VDAHYVSCHNKEDEDGFFLFTLFVWLAVMEGATVLLKNKGEMNGDWG
jgi:hypothetical protein